MTHPRNNDTAATDQLLASSFADVGLAATRTEQDASKHDFHLLSYEFPACNLLPGVGVLPNLESPLNVARREPPPVNRRMIGVADTTFYTAFTINRRSPVWPMQPPHNHMSLIAAIQELSNERGTSKLELVCYYDGQLCDTIYRFKLATKYEQPESAKVTLFDLTFTHWTLLQGFSDDYEWIQTLQGLVTRSSYRAVYHVRERLASFYGEAKAASEEQAWPYDWGSLSASAPWNLQEWATGLAMTGSRTYAATYQSWMALDTSILRGGTKARVLSMTAFRGLHAALKSLSPPELIIPRKMCHATSHHTKLVFEEFERLLYRRTFASTLTAEQLLTYLRLQAMETTVDLDAGLTLSNVMLKPGWQLFLQAWLTRTANFVTQRRCFKKGHDHSGRHQHGTDEWYNADAWEMEAAALNGEDVDEDHDEDDLDEEEEPPATVQDIERMMHGTTMRDEHREEEDEEL